MYSERVICPLLFKYLFFLVLDLATTTLSQKLCPGYPHCRGNISTVNLLVLTSSDQLHFLLKLYFITKQPSLKRRSTVLCLPLQWGFPASSIKVSSINWANLLISISQNFCFNVQLEIKKVFLTLQKFNISITLRTVISTDVRSIPFSVQKFMSRKCHNLLDSTEIFDLGGSDKHSSLLRSSLKK